MLKRELKVNLKPFFFFLIAMATVYFVTFLIYPSITNSVEDIDKLMQTMPKELLQMFNMDTISLKQVSGWLKTEGYVMITLIGGIYFGILGSNILLKEETNGTISFLIAKPITRNKIIKEKLIAGTIYVFAFNIILSILLLIGLKLSDDLKLSDFMKIAIAPTFLHLFIFQLSVAISTFHHNTSSSTPTAIGTIFVLYTLNVLAALSDKIEFLKYFTPFSYVDITVQSKALFINLLILLSATLIPILVTIINYNKKELA